MQRPNPRRIRKLWTRSHRRQTQALLLSWQRQDSVLAMAGVEFEEIFLDTREQYEKLQKDGHLLFDQVPLVEMDGTLLT